MVGCKHINVIQECISVLAAPREVRSTFFFARLQSAGFYFVCNTKKTVAHLSAVNPH